MATLRTLGRALGLFQGAPAPAGPPAEMEARINALVGERDEARRAKNWQRSDELRAELAALGVTVEDTAAGARWKWKGA